MLTLVGIIAAALCLPASSVAGTLSWDLPADFTRTAPGANPDHDSYGAAPWSYVDAVTAGGALAISPPATPSAFRRLDTFVDLGGGNAGWRDSAETSGFVGASTSQLQLQPAADRTVAVGWTSPLNGSEQVRISGSFHSLASCALTGPTWTLEQDGHALSSGGDGQLAASASVPPGGSIYLTVDYTGGPLAYDASCETAAVSLRLSASIPPPSVTLTSPAHGAVISGGQPTFAGSASNRFGDSNRVSVHIYNGAKATGSLFQTVVATPSGGTYSVSPAGVLPDGQYTAQAEQQDLGGGVGRSAPVTFVVQDGPVVGRIVMGSAVTLSRSGRVTTSVTYQAPTGQTCRGYVLILTTRRYRTSPGGPLGRLRVLFAYVSVPGGKTATVSRALSPRVTQLLRGRGSVSLRVTANFTGAKPASAGRSLTLVS